MLSSKPFLYLCIILMVPVNMAIALPEDSQQPINIQADRANQSSIDSGGEKTTYTGNVKMTQGSLLIKGDEVIIFSKERKVTELVATGNPAYFEQQSDPAKPPVKAKANKIEYILKTDLLVLLNQASIDQDGSIIQGEKINYNIASESVDASGGDNNSRVIMILEPDKDTNQTNKKVETNEEPNQ